MITTLKPRSNHSVTLQVRFHGAKIAPGFHPALSGLVNGAILFLITGTLPTAWAQDVVQQLAAQAIEAARAITDSSVPAEVRNGSKANNSDNPVQQGKPQEAESRKTVTARECFTLESGEKECVEYLLDAETGEPVEQWKPPEERKDEGMSVPPAAGLGREDVGRGDER